MDKFFVVINESDENSWSAYVWSDVEGKAEIFYDNNTIKNPILKKLKKLHFGNRINNKLHIPFKSVWNHSLCIGFDDLNKKDRNYIIFQSNVKFAPAYINRLKKEKNAVIILYLPDTVKNLGIANDRYELEKYISYYGIDMIFSFDTGDCKKYNFEFFDIYSGAEGKNESERKNTDLLWDLFYVGSARTKKRVDLLHDIYKKAEGALDCNFNIVGVEEGDIIFPDKILYNSPITYKDVIKRVLKSNCILEVLNGNQVGNTLRFKEAVCFNKKLLTNNPEIKKSKYYNESFIQVFTDINDIDTEWIKQREIVDFKYSGDFSPVRLLDEIIKRDHGGVRD